jgi:hypothetical protein
MSHQRYELLEYKNKYLIEELNEFMIAVKVYLFDVPIKRTKPTVEEIDSLQARINTILKQDAKPLIRR